VGMLLPNLQRCIPAPARDEQGHLKIQAQFDWANALSQLEMRSQRLGTCLLTGQQMMVDVSSNPR